MTWQEGRELASVTKGGVATSYEYNSDGIRTKKASGNEYTYYRLAGDKIVEIKRTVNGSTERYSFTYDENGRPYSVNAPGLDPGTVATYYYVYNIQGDVIKLIDNYGNAEINYCYHKISRYLSIKANSIYQNGESKWKDCQTCMLFLYLMEVEKNLQPMDTDQFMSWEMVNMLLEFIIMLIILPCRVSL